MALADYSSELISTAQSLATAGKGILAVEESTKTIGKRLGSIGVENTEANRQAYRGMLFTTSGLGDFISGAILYEETLFQNHQQRPRARHSGAVAAGRPQCQTCF